MINLPRCYHIKRYIGGTRGFNNYAAGYSNSSAQIHQHDAKVKDLGHVGTKERRWREAVGQGFWRSYFKMQARRKIGNGGSMRC